MVAFPQWMESLCQSSTFQVKVRSASQPHMSKHTCHYILFFFLVLTFFQFSFIDNKPVFAVTNSPFPVCLAPSLIFLPDCNWLSLLFQLFLLVKTLRGFFSNTVTCWVESHITSSVYLNSLLSPETGGLAVSTGISAGSTSSYTLFRNFGVRFSIK